MSTLDVMVLLHKFESATVDELVEELDCSATTVRRYLREAESGKYVCRDDERPQVWRLTGSGIRYLRLIGAEQLST